VKASSTLSIHFFRSSCGLKLRRLVSTKKPNSGSGPGGKAAVICNNGSGAPGGTASTDQKTENGDESQKDADNALAEINDLQESDKEARLVALQLRDLKMAAIRFGMEPPGNCVP